MRSISPHTIQAQWQWIDAKTNDTHYSLLLDDSIEGKEEEEEEREWHSLLTVHINGVERALISQLQAHHNHPGNPEEKDVVSGFQHSGRIKASYLKMWIEGMSGGWKGRKEEIYQMTTSGMEVTRMKEKRRQ
jgi:hypothetical protein